MNVHPISDALYPLVEQYKNEPYIEIEMRLGKFNGSMFDTNISKENFEKILKALHKYEGWEQVRETEEEVFYRDTDGIRITIDETTGEEKIIRKERVLNKDFKKLKASPFDVRFSVSREIPLPPDTDRQMDKKKLKQRTSFLRKNLSIDMTTVTGDSHDMDSEDPVSYQVEFEIVDPKMIQTKEQMFNLLHKIKDLINILHTNKK